MKAATLDFVGRLVATTNTVIALYFGFKVYGSTKSMSNAFGTVFAIQGIGCIITVALIWYLAKWMPEEEKTLYLSGA